MNQKPLSVILNAIKDEYSDLYNWLQEISRWNKVEDFVIPDYKKRVRVKFFTKDNEYSISAKHPERDKFAEDKRYDDGYLGCIVRTRKPRAGESWNRGNDLPDGAYCKETWDSIVRAIVSYELVKVVKPRERMHDYVSKAGVPQIADPNSEDSLNK